MEDDASRKKTENPQNNRPCSSLKFEAPRGLKADRTICDLQKRYDAKRQVPTKRRANHRSVMLVQQNDQPRFRHDLPPDTLEDQESEKKAGQDARAYHPDPTRPSPHLFIYFRLHTRSLSENTAAG
jgi:hypothetical protein